MIVIYIALLWLLFCAWQDWKKREISNWLTIPAIVIAVPLRIWLDYTLYDGIPLYLLGMSALIIAAAGIGYLAKLMGGADTKVVIALAIVSPILALWAWIGAILWWLLLRGYASIRKDKDKLPRLPAMLGFVAGTFAYLLMAAVAFPK